MSSIEEDVAGLEPVAGDSESTGRRPGVLCVEVVVALLPNLLGPNSQRHKSSGDLRQQVGIDHQCASFACVVECSTGTNDVASLAQFDVAFEVDLDAAVDGLEELRRDLLVVVHLGPDDGTVGRKINGSAAEE